MKQPAPPSGPETQPHQPARVRPFLWMLLGSFCFAIMGGFAHHLGRVCEWPVIALARSVIPVVLGAVLARAAGVRLVFPGPRLLWLRSLAGSCSLLGTFYALTRLPTSEVFTLTNMFPLWVAILSWPLLGQAPSGAVWVSVACGLSGVVLIQWPHLGEGSFQANLALFVALGASFSGAVAMIGLHRLGGLDPRAIVVHFSATSLAFSLTAYLLTVGATVPPALRRTEILLCLLGVGVTATAGQLCLTLAFTGGAPAQVAVVGLTQIVFAMGLDAVLFDRVYPPVTLTGIALVVGPTAWLMTRRR